MTKEIEPRPPPLPIVVRTHGIVGLLRDGDMRPTHVGEKKDVTVLLVHMATAGRSVVVSPVALLKV